MRTGFTLIELVIVLAVTSMGLSLLVPAAQTWADRLAVIGARESLVGLISTTRSMALAHGGAVLTIDEVSGTAWIETAGGILMDSLSLVDPFRVSVELPGTRIRSRLRYDTFGIGRVASQSIRFSRGHSESRVVVSSYGGVTRR